MQNKFINLSQQRVLALQEGGKNHFCYQFQDPCRCLLLSTEGKAVKQLAQLLQVSTVSIYSWFHKWADKAIAGLVNVKDVNVFSQQRMQRR